MASLALIQIIWSWQITVNFNFPFSFCYILSSASRVGVFHLVFSRLHSLVDGHCTTLRCGEVQLTVRNHQSRKLTPTCNNTMEGIESDHMVPVEEPGEEREVPNIGAHIRNQSLRKYFDNYCAQSDANAEFRPMDITVKVPERFISLFIIIHHNIKTQNKFFRIVAYHVITLSIFSTLPSLPPLHRHLLAKVHTLPTLTQPLTPHFHPLSTVHNPQSHNLCRSLIHSTLYLCIRLPALSC